MKELNPSLTETEIQTLLNNYPLWKWNKENGIPFLTMEYKFPSFPSAFLFLTKLAFVSESLDHHAEIWNVYNQVRLKLYTHDQNTLTKKDYEWIKRLMEHTNF
ncbi:4a-hydroxytetrahydrobiopterin dehydratase [Leptospira biflexa serovar Patoc strain 'Patoc 1 (Ames)']|jgi:4a-hydroxytetrahydrobiopterin dehydratase|uniref:4a-hydroxytetrahydrobiopterin dehydratase n=1 Tax=Leptospira biflexa serovar Patoc (strain Patoc 1 / ATCC 23582 / Paris) TaxID=456481 RepID=B0SLP4_LEPBP|nr:4a-hydroxytetrahydrobiopterin dehydratase [Leptospira biflexa]ABZ93321.1 4a-hydroxytetrahydrobiopterin dehydratase [Leptospira biflexa serovar Patoc strain 'Patoc 1 (Ames)']ABZ96946.1 Putative pterin-4-alpha-carbinolamine dehydratase [Leptospira biflexa serovar Patoc strain 'Patoc 1 (Paris)']TGM38212.1 4a-hydroxytetrahydrobiopterin dehydratase [Leptospira biflexa]TGM41543.1 4a-hydroxytetrahydrobiopterin dehydratase [Leptospira biflexa]